LLQAAASSGIGFNRPEREKQVDRFVSEVEDSLAALTGSGRGRDIAGKRDFPDQVVFDDLATQPSQSSVKPRRKKALAAVREI